MPTATEAARAALHRLAQLGLPPTPENFQRFFAEAMGGGADPAQPRPLAAGPGDPGSEARELMQAVRRFAEQLVDATGSLAEDIGERNAELKQSMGSMDALADLVAEPEVATLLGTVLSITTNMHATVEASHAELLRTRDEIEQLKVELQQSREWMQQDPLTGMQNRRGMDAMLTREVARARRSGTALSVSMLDLDKFKSVNDTFGHHAGDRVLVHMAEISKSVLRETDIIVRYGGEEFLLILPDTDINGARFVLDRLQLVVNKTPLVYEGRKIAVSFSAGLAQLKADENGSALVIRADRAMLQAKAEGRNRIVAAEG
jgi:diguanylate cyclase